MTRGGAKCDFATNLLRSKHVDNAKKSISIMFIGSLVGLLQSIPQSGLLRLRVPFLLFTISLFEANNMMPKKREGLLAPCFCVRDR